MASLNNSQMEAAVSSLTQKLTAFEETLSPEERVAFIGFMNPEFEQSDVAGYAAIRTVTSVAQGKYGQAIGHGVDAYKQARKRSWLGAISSR